MCKGRSVEPLYITFPHSGLFTLGLYPEYIDTDNFYFQWPSRTKMQRLYHLRSPYLRDNNFEVLYSAIALDIIDLNFVDIVKDKPTGNDLGFITYLNTIEFHCKWIDNSDYLITLFFLKKRFSHRSNIWKIQKVIKVRKISDKDDILNLKKKE